MGDSWTANSKYEPVDLSWIAENSLTACYHVISHQHLGSRILEIKDFFCIFLDDDDYMYFLTQINQNIYNNYNHIERVRTSGIGLRPSGQSSS